MQCAPPMEKRLGQNGVNASCGAHLLDLQSGTPQSMTHGIYENLEVQSMFVQPYWHMQHASSN